MPNEAAALTADPSPTARAKPKSRINSRWAFVSVLVVASVLIVHYVWWSSSNHPERLNDPDFGNERPGGKAGKKPVDVTVVGTGKRNGWKGDEKDEGEQVEADLVLIEDPSKQPEKRPEKQEENAEEPTDNNAEEAKEASSVADDSQGTIAGSTPGSSKDEKGKRTCDGQKHAFDSDGKPCIDLKMPLFRQLIYMTDRPDVQYLYCAIPKNGCTYHLALMHRIHGVENYEAAGVIHDRDRKDRHLIDSRGSPAIAKMLANESLPKYMVIRNPLRRTLSAYLDKVQPNLPKDERTVEAFHEWIYEEYPKGLPVDRSWARVNPHWKPELQFCGYKVRDVQSVFKVFRVEEPEGYVDFLYSIIPEKYLKDGWRGKENLSFREHVLGPRKRTGNTDEKFEEYFNDLELFDHMSWVLQKDIKVLGYEEEVAEMRENLKRNLGML